MKKGMLVSTLLAGGIAALGLTRAARAEEPPPYVQIDSVIAGGSGCPDGTAQCTISDDKKLLSCLFDAFSASSGPGIHVTDSRKSCDLRIAMDFPQGFSFSIVQAEWRGGAELDPGVNATQSALYYFPFSNQARFQTNISGPFAGDYFRRDALGVAALVWSPCGADYPLNIKSEVRVDRVSGKSGLLTADSVDLKVQEIFGLVWRTCH